MSIPDEVVGAHPVFTTVPTALVAIASLLRRNVPFSVTPGPDDTFRVECSDGGAVKAADELKPHYLVIQEGGSSSELYVHLHDTERSAKNDRKRCSNRGAYRTSPVVEIPPCLGILEEQVIGLVEAVAKATLDMSHPH